MSDRRLLAACIAASVAGVLLSAFIHSSLANPRIYSDITDAFWSRGWVQAGQVPYSPGTDLFEYPPISGLVLYAARMIGGAISGLAGGTYTGYYVGFSALSLVAAAVLGWSAWRLANARGISLNPLYFLLPSMVIYSVYNFDLFNALFILLSVQLFVEKRRGWSAGFLGVALATKLVGGVLLPIFLLELPDWRERGRYLAASLLVAAACLVPIAVFNFGWFNQFVSYFAGWGLEDAWYIWVFGDPFSRAAKVFGAVLLGLLLLRVYTLKMPLVERSFVALAAYLLSTTIYAPQFNVMLVPFLAVLALTSPYVFIMDISNALIILTWFSVPAGPGFGPTYAWTVPQLMALIRSAALALLSLSVAAGSGHSLWGWVRARARRSPPLNRPEKWIPGKSA